MQDSANPGQRKAVMYQRLLIAAISLSLFFTVLWPNLVKVWRSAVGTPRNHCYFKLGYLAKAFQLYCSDHDGFMPRASAFDDELLPYARIDSPLTCTSSTPYFYVYNRRLEGKNVFAMSRNDQESTILFFDSLATEKNASGGKELMAPEGRHERGWINAVTVFGAPGMYSGNSRIWDSLDEARL